MAVDKSKLVDFTKKQVILVTKGEDGNAHEFEGTVSGASPAGLAFKQKGKRDVSLVEPDDIEDIRLAPVKPKKMVQKKVDVIKEGNVRQHLVDRHGSTLEEGNELTEDQAVAMHDSTEHKGLGHRHEAKENKDKESSEEQSAA